MNSLDWSTSESGRASAVAEPVAIGRERFAAVPVQLNTSAITLALAQQSAGANEGTVAYTLAAIKDWTFLLGPGWVVGWGNGLILRYLMYRSGLVPRGACWLGLIGGPLIIASGTAILLTGNDRSDALRSLQAVGTLPPVRELEGQAARSPPAAGLSPNGHVRPH